MKNLKRIMLGAPLFLLSLVAGLSASNGFAESQETWVESIRHSVDFFDQYAWDEQNGAYYSEITFDGQVKSEARHLMALSRTVYGLSYAAKYDVNLLDRAKASAQFILNNMVAEDELGPYFIRTIDGNGDPILVEQLVVNRQAYGLTGLIALYDVTRDEELAVQIGRLYDSFMRRFRDTSGSLGFFDVYDLRTKAPIRSKSYNSTVYVATSFLLEYVRITGNSEATEIAKELADIVATHFIDQETGWIFENFNSEWQPWIKQVSSLPVDEALATIQNEIPAIANQHWQFQEVDSQLRTIGVTGHNFQAAWFLMRMATDPRYDPSSRKLWAQSARSILTSMLTNRAIDQDHGGVFDVFQRETGEHMWHTNKAWWQQAEAILALTLAEKSGILATSEVRSVRDEAIQFYFQNFIDRDNGGEFAEVTADGTPTSDNGQIKDKGQPGKSIYHAVELARFMIFYSDQ